MVYVHKKQKNRMEGVLRVTLTCLFNMLWLFESGSRFLLGHK